MGTVNRWVSFQGTHWHDLGPSTCPQNGSSSWNCELEPGHPAHWLVAGTLSLTFPSMFPHG